MRPLLSITFPQGFQICKNYGHPTLGRGGGKDTFKLYLKSEHTDKQTDKHMDKSTYRKQRPREPMLWKCYKTKKKSNCDKKHKNSIVTKIKNSNCDKIQKLKLGQNLKTQIITKLENLNSDKTKKSNYD